MRLLWTSLFAITLLVTEKSQAASDWQSWVNEGVRAYKAGDYQSAAKDFQRAVELNRSEISPHLYLGTTWMAQWIPGAATAENAELARKAEAEFEEALKIEPNNPTALESLASLSYSQAQNASASEEKQRKFQEAAGWYEKVLLGDPTNKQAHYSLGMIVWAASYPDLRSARAALGMTPATPGPLTDPAVRQKLKAQYFSPIEGGISHLERALEIDPLYDDAMVYMNLLMRERASLRDTAEEYRQDIEEADLWVQKAMETKRSKAAAQGGTPSAAPEPTASGAPVPRRIRVGGAVQEANLIRRVDPIYPAAALEARVQGTVSFLVTIGSDGRVMTTQLISGPPLLTESARDAVRHWIYRPTLLNSQPVEVITSVDVNFTLPN